MVRMNKSAFVDSGSLRPRRGIWAIWRCYKFRVLYILVLVPYCTAMSVKNIEEWTLWLLPAGDQIGGILVWLAVAAASSELAG